LLFFFGTRVEAILLLVDVEVWRVVLAVALVTNAVIGLAYRIYRLRKGGPRADVVGQAALGAVLVALAGALALGAGWPRWAALGYGVLFGLVVMPIWVLAVLIPLRPGPLDYTFTACYWAVLVVVVVASLGA
jgi:hypothetical protein